MKTDKSDFTSKKKLIFTTPKNYPQLSLERTIVFTANTVIKIISFLSWLLYAYTVMRHAF